MTQLREAIAAIRAWGEVRDWRGYDPYDGLNSPLAALARGKLSRRLLTQVVKLSPLNLRPLLGIRPAWNQKAIGLVASGYARLAVAEEDDGARAAAIRFLDWLVDNHADVEDGVAWGYHFPVQTRIFRYPPNSPNTIATTFVVQALLDGCELLGEPRFEQPVREATSFLLGQLLADRPGGAYFRYIPGEDDLIHNANALACAVLARAGRVLDEQAFVGAVRRALPATLSAQRRDGSWPYAADASHSWVDNFHTGYVLESLAVCSDTEPDAVSALAKGVAYWERELFLPDGTPKYFPDRTFPLDAHNYAQTIETWTAVARWHPGAIERATRAARLLVDCLLDPEGYIHFQRRRFWSNRVPLIRWSTAPAFRALTGLLLTSRREEPSESEVEHANLG